MHISHALAFHMQSHAVKRMQVQKKQPRSWLRGGVRSNQSNPPGYGHAMTNIQYHCTTYSRVRSEDSDFWNLERVAGPLIHTDHALIHTKKTIDPYRYIGLLIHWYGKNCRDKTILLIHIYRPYIGLIFIKGFRFKEK